MTTDWQVRLLMSLLKEGTPLVTAAAKAGMSEPTARKYRRVKKLPSELRPVRTWRTREDSPGEVWPDVEADAGARWRPGSEDGLRGTATAPSGAVHGGAVAYAAAPLPAVACVARAFEGGVLPPGSGARRAVPVGLHRHAAAVGDDWRRAAGAPMLPLRAGVLELGVGDDHLLGDVRGAGGRATGEPVGVGRGAGGTSHRQPVRGDP